MAKAELDKLGKLENDILTPEERAALAEDDPEEEAAAQKRAGTHVAPTAKGADPNDDDDDDTEDDDKKGDAAAETDGEAAKPAITDPAATAAAAPAKDEAAERADSTPDRPQAFVPQLPKVDIPADAAAKLATRRAELEAKQTALDKEHDDGEMATAAYRALQAGLRKEEKAIDREEFALESAVRENKRIDEANRSMEQQLWASQCEHFIATHEQYKSKVMEGALNAAVIAVANSEEGKTKKGFWILEQAHRAVMKEFGQITPATKAAAAAPSKGKAEATKAPVTLGNVPAAAEAEVGKDKYAAIDALADKGDWLGYEREIRKLSDEEAAEFSDVGRTRAL